MALRVIAAIGMTMFAGGLYIDATHWYLPIWTPWRARRILKERQRAQSQGGGPSDQIGS
jgi:hypothetical protein